MDRDYARKHAGNRAREMRSRIAAEAARIMSEQGVRDFGVAKRKAAERLGVSDEQSLPRNAEIEEALREFQRLFQGDTQPRALRERREAAVEAMRFFARFEPRLVGAVLEGTADEHSAVCLHLFSDDPAAVQWFLDENRIPYDESSRKLRLERDRYEEFPAYLFSADGLPIDLTVLPRDALRQAPIDRVDERPMARASLNAVVDLLRSDDLEKGLGPRA
jgi:hypothetical protein